MQSSPDHFAPRFGRLYRSLIVSVRLAADSPRRLLLRTGTPAVTALAIAAIFPFGDAVAGLVRKRASIRSPSSR